MISTSALTRVPAPTAVNRRVRWAVTPRHEPVSAQTR